MKLNLHWVYSAATEVHTRPKVKKCHNKPQ